MATKRKLIKYPLAASTQHAGLLDGKPVGQWIHTFSWCPVSVTAALQRRSETKMNPKNRGRDRKSRTRLEKRQTKHNQAMIINIYDYLRSPETRYFRFLPFLSSSCISRTSSETNHRRSASTKRKETSQHNRLRQ